LSATAGFNSSPDATKGVAFFAFAADLADAAFGGSGVPGLRARQDGISRSLRSAQFNTACAVVSGNSVTFNNCTVSESGFNITFNGSITASAGSVTWGINSTFSGTDQGITFNMSMNFS